MVLHVHMYHIFVCNYIYIYTQQMLDAFPRKTSVYTKHVVLRVGSLFIPFFLFLSFSNSFVHSDSSSSRS